MRPNQSVRRLAVLFVATLACQAPPSVVGTWEYRQENSGAPSGYDAEGERLEFRLQGDALVGAYFGLEREGEEGLFYTATVVTELSVDRNGHVALVVPARSLYSSRPGSLAEASAQAGESAGFTRDELRMEGEVRGDRLVLACRSTAASCPDRALVFRKSPGQ